MMIEKMTKNRYTLLPSPAIEAELDAALKGLGSEIDDLKLPKLAAVVLGGGYGRGEGGVCRTTQGDRLYNDLDIFVFSDGANRAETLRISAGLAQIAARWETRLGVAVDLSPVKELSALRRVADKLMYQELVRGWHTIWGDIDLRQLIPLLPPEKLPFSEAARLILNRGMGLILAGERLAAGDRDADFIMRNMHKSQLGAGDALLIAAGKYRWHGEERLAELNEYVRISRLPRRIADNYEQALRYKAEPHPELPDDPSKKWRECRDCLLEAARHIAECSGQPSPQEVVRGLHCRAAGERSLRNFLRWILRDKSFRRPAYAFDPPEVSVAGMLYSLLATGESCPACPSSLRRRWNKFN